jgi:hypothetical protein
MEPKRRTNTVICIESARLGFSPEVPPPQPAQSKRLFFGNASTDRSVLAMFDHWKFKVARHHRIPAERVEQRIFEGIVSRRVA